MQHLIRLYIPKELKEGKIIKIRREEGHYLINVRRINEKEGILVYNQRYGEYLAHLSPLSGSYLKKLQKNQFNSNHSSSSLDSLYKNHIKLQRGLENNNNGNHQKNNVKDLYSMEQIEEEDNQSELTLLLQHKTREPMQREGNKSFGIYLSLLEDKEKAYNAIRNATEGGSSFVHGIISERSQLSQSSKKANSTNQWFIWAKESSQQCGRLDIPKVEWDDGVFSIPLKNSLSRSSDPLICCVERSQAPPLSQIASSIYQNHNNCAVLIGPEGGFTQNELNLFSEWKTKKVYFASLGPHILRSENAISAACAILQDSIRST